MKTLHSTVGPSDNKCLEHDAKMVGRYDMEPFIGLGYKSIHLCLRDKILNGENVKEISTSTGLGVMTIKNAAIRMSLKIQPAKRGLGHPNIGRQDKRGVGPYPEHKCTAHGCTRLTTHRFLCSECFMKGERDDGY